MNRLLFIFLVVLFSYEGFCQEKPITTFILIRHAEKDLTQSTNDPDLSPEGEIRAAKLEEILRRTQLDAIYSTAFKRTRQTVESIANARSLPIMSYQGQVVKDIEVMLSKHAGQTILVSGHSNTIPQVINYLIDEEKYQSFEDSEYGNLVIVTVTERGKNAKVVWLTY